MTIVVPTTRRQRPAFHIVRFVTIGGGQGLPLLEEPKNPAEPKKLEEPLDDDIGL
jgi:hypothetical protein